MDSILWTFILIFLGINAGFSALVAYVAKQKGRSSSGFFWLSFFLSFLVGILVVLAMPKKDEQLVQSEDSSFTKNSAGEELVKCPFCAEWVKSEAKVCKFCKRDIESEIADLKREEANQTIAAAKLATARSEEEELKRIELEKERKKEFKKFLSSRKFFIGLSVVLLALVVVSIISIIKVGEEQDKAQQAQQIADQKAEISERARSDWDFALTRCEESHPSGISDSGTTLSEDGNTLTIQQSEGSNTGFVLCVLKSVVEDPDVEKLYKDRDSQLSNYFGDPLPLSGETEVIIQRGTNGSYIGTIVISRSEK